MILLYSISLKLTLQEQCGTALDPLAGVLYWAQVEAFNCVCLLCKHWLRSGGRLWVSGRQSQCWLEYWATVSVRHERRIASPFSWWVKPRWLLRAVNRCSINCLTSWDLSRLWASGWFQCVLTEPTCCEHDDGEHNESLPRCRLKQDLLMHIPACPLKPEAMEEQRVLLLARLLRCHECLHFVFGRNLFYCYEFGPWPSLAQGMQECSRAEEGWKPEWWHLLQWVLQRHFIPKV